MRSDRRTSRKHQTKYEWIRNISFELVEFVHSFGSVSVVVPSPLPPTHTRQFNNLCHYIVLLCMSVCRSGRGFGCLWMKFVHIFISHVHTNNIWAHEYRRTIERILMSREDITIDIGNNVQCDSIENNRKDVATFHVSCSSSKITNIYYALASGSNSNFSSTVVPSNPLDFYAYILSIFRPSCESNWCFSNFVERIELLLVYVCSHSHLLPHMQFWKIIFFSSVQFVVPRSRNSVF